MPEQATTTEAAKHAPGPWVIFETGKPRRPSSVCLLGEKGHVSDICKFECGSIRPRGLEEKYSHTQDVDFANARLIAAAPELLEACKNALKVFSHPDNFSNHFPMPPPEWDELRTIIAKAEGRDAECLSK